jgi:hypothetical protein
MAISTTGVTRYDMNNNAATDVTAALGNASLTALSGVLKDVYLPAFNNTLYFDNKFTRLIETAAAKLDATGRRIIGYFKTKRSTGVGPIEEGGTFVDATPVGGIQGWEWLKYQNMYVEFTGPALATVQAGQGSYIDLVQEHIESLMDSSRIHLERQLMGAGDGVLAKVAALPGSDSANIPVTGPAFFDTQYLELGLGVKIIAPVTGTTVSLRQTDDTSNVDATGNIAALTTGNKRTSTYGTMSIGLTVDIDDTTVAANDWIVKKTAYGTLVDGSSAYTCLEPNGLMNLVSDGSSTCSSFYGTENTDNFKMSWNLDRTSAANSVLKSVTYNIADELDEENLLAVLIEAENLHQAQPNLAIFSPRAILKYFLNNRADRRFNTMTAFEWTGGYKGLGIQLGDKQLMLTSMPSVPTGIGFMINTADFAFVRPTGWSGYRWLTGAGGDILTQKEGSDNKFASAVDYFNFVCTNPAKQIKLYVITE